ncbi:MAG: ATP-dependent helicase [Synechococcaceae cyanobacterium SM2_3_1]|nr:ATP-dependent helicase [Synechococcaceae cyanobacterium SM2_3_1]
MDEAQDLSRAQLELVLKLPSPTGRMVFVGDPNQAIFGFAGSDDQSWGRIREAIHPTEFPLSITYRCPKSHVALAARLVPQIEASPSAPQGEVKVISSNQIKSLVKAGDLVICRFTAPLIALCLKLVIQEGIPAKVRGREIGKLLSALVKVVAQRFPKHFLEELNTYVGAKVEQLERDGKLASIESLKDRAAALETCFEVFGSECQGIPEFCQRIEALFDDEIPQSKCIILSTIHRAKGDEAERVFLLQSDSMPTLSLGANDWQKQQEQNLLYVALTRAKHRLFLVPMPRQNEQVQMYLDDPQGGIRFEDCRVVTQVSQLGVKVQSDFEIEVDALHQAVRKMLLDFVEVAQVWQADFPEQMQVVWIRLNTELKGSNLGIPFRFDFDQPEPKSRSPANFYHSCEWEIFAVTSGRMER